MGAPASPLKDPSGLDSALARPRNAAHFEDADLVRQAVLLAVGISQSQAFLDGNKRAAYAAADIFLRINGLVFVGRPLGMARWLERVAEAGRGADRELRVEQFEAWLRVSTRPIERGDQPSGPARLLLNLLGMLAPLGVTIEARWRRQIDR